MLPSQVYRTSYELRWLDAGFLQSGHLQLDGSPVEYLQSGHFPGWKILSPGGGFVPLCVISIQDNAAGNLHEFILLGLMILGILASLYFMWSVRHPKTE